MRDKLEDWHRTIAAVGGQVSISITRGRMRPGSLMAWSRLLAQAAREMESAVVCSETTVSEETERKVKVRQEQGSFNLEDTQMEKQTRTKSRKSRKS